MILSNYILECVWNVCGCVMLSNKTKILLVLGETLFVTQSSTRDKHRTKNQKMTRTIGKNENKWKCKNQNLALKPHPLIGGL